MNTVGFVIRLTMARYGDNKSDDAANFGIFKQVRL